MDLKEKVLEVINKLTLEEKLTFTAGSDIWHMGSCERIGIPPVKVTDGPNGVRGATKDHLSITPSLCIPCGMGLGASFDEELLYEGGRILAVQAKEKGASILLAPTLNLARHLLWGRCFETFSEDPVHAGLLGAAFISGVQSQNVMATAKHYVGNESETERYTASSEIDERSLREIYLLPFEYAVKKGKVATLMTGYPRLNGSFVPEQSYYLDTVLRKEWGFDGFVMSDWFANFDAGASFEAGLDVEMPGPPRFFGDNLKKYFTADKLSEEKLNEKVFNVISILAKMNVINIEQILTNSQNDFFKNKIPVEVVSDGTAPSAADNNNIEHPVDREEDRQVQYKLAVSATVLLENKSLLPLEKSSINSLAIIGPNAEELQIMGGGSAGVVPHQRYSFLEVMKESLPNATIYRCIDAPGPDSNNGIGDEYIDECKNLAKKAQYVLLILGTTSRIESEGYDKETLSLPDGQDRLAEAILAINKNTVIVINAGTPYLMPWAKKCPALLQAFFGGMEMSKALRDILLGEADPSGRLPVTVPQRLEHTPAFCDFPAVNGKVVYGEQIFMGYRWYEKRAVEPLYPFGYGLSYADFIIENQELLSPEGNSLFTVRCSLANISDRDGSACIQLYVKSNNRARPIRLPKPVKELKRFAKVSLSAGEKAELVFNFCKRDFAYYDPGDADWESLIAQNSPFLYSHGGDLPEVSHRTKPGWYVEKGEYEICTGFSSAHIVCVSKVTIEHDEFLSANGDIDF